MHEQYLRTLKSDMKLQTFFLMPIFIFTFYGLRIKLKKGKVFGLSTLLPWLKYIEMPSSFFFPFPFFIQVVSLLILVFLFWECVSHLLVSCLSSMVETCDCLLYSLSLWCLSNSDWKSQLKIPPPDTRYRTEVKERRSCCNVIS